MANTFALPLIFVSRKITEDEAWIMFRLGVHEMIRIEKWCSLDLFMSLFIKKQYRERPLNGSSNQGSSDKFRLYCSIAWSLTSWSLITIVMRFDVEKHVWYVALYRWKCWESQCQFYRERQPSVTFVECKVKSAWPKRSAINSKSLMVLVTVPHRGRPSWHLKPLIWASAPSEANLRNTITPLVLSTRNSSNWWRFKAFLPLRFDEGDSKTPDRVIKEEPRNGWYSLCRVALVSYFRPQSRRIAPAACVDHMRGDNFARALRVHTSSVFETQIGWIFLNFNNKNNEKNQTFLFLQITFPSTIATVHWHFRALELQALKWNYSGK